MNLYFTEICSARKRGQAEYAMAAFNSKWKYEKLDVVVRASLRLQSQNVVILRSRFAEDAKEIYKNL